MKMIMMMMDDNDDGDDDNDSDDDDNDDDDTYLDSYMIQMLGIHHLLQGHHYKAQLRQLALNLAESSPLDFAAI